MRPEEILPQGDGSGLDADTVDGLHAKDLITRRSSLLIIPILWALFFFGGTMSADVSQTGRRTAIDPIHNAMVVTPSDNDNLPFVTTALRLASGGAVRVTLLGGTTVTYPSGALNPGISHPMRVTRVWATGTTVPGGSIIAEW